MPYTTQSALIDRFGTDMLIELTDHEDEPIGVIDEDTVAAAIAATDAIIDGFVVDRYALPMAEVPPLLAEHALLIAIYKLHRFEPDPKIETDFKTAMRGLEQIGDGRVKLSVAGVSPKVTGDTGARTTDRARPMTADNLKGYI